MILASGAASPWRSVIGAVELREVTSNALVNLRQPPLHLALRKVPVPRVDGFELATIDRNARLAEQLKASAQHHELTADLADGRAIVLAEIGYRPEVRHQAAGQPNQLDVALALPLQPPARLHPIEVSVNVNPQQRRRMIGRSSRRLWLDPAKAEFCRKFPGHGGVCGCRADPTRLFASDRSLELGLLLVAQRCIEIVK